MSGMVTISAPFGASGNLVGRGVAERLGLPFFDRAIPAAVAKRLAVPMDEALGHDERPLSGLNRLAWSLAYAANPLGPSPLIEKVDDPDRFRQETERILHGIADTTGGVVLGRAGMVVLRNRPDVLRVRLDGPLEERIAQVMRSENMSEDAARAMQRDIDGAREGYLRAFYQAHQANPELYQVILEVTSLGADACTAAIVDIARRHLANWLPSGESEPAAD
jgi:cytidylate kinase